MSKPGTLRAMTMWSLALLGRGGRIALILTLLLLGPGGPLALVHPVGSAAPASASDPTMCDATHHPRPPGHPPTDCAICHALYLLRWQPTVRFISLTVDLTPKLPLWPGDVRREHHRADAPAPSRAPPAHS